MDEVRRRMVATAQNLTNKITEINLSVSRDDGNKPRVRGLRRQLAGLEATWAAYEAIHMTYVVRAEDRQEIEDAGTQHKEHLHDYELATEGAEDLIARREEDAQKLATEAAAQQGAQAAADEEVESARRKEQDYNIAKAQRDDLFRRVAGLSQTRAPIWIRTAHRSAGIALKRR